MASPDSREYQRLLERLFAARRFGVDLGVERISAVLSAAGDPHLAISSRVTIAGTNGKGSTAAFLESIARSAGVSTGLFTSPHIARFAERFRIDGELADESAIAAGAARAGAEHLTFFEQCTAIAAVLFADAGVELGIFEVGLGGRLDATRAVDAPLVIITGVSYDHCDVLGHDLASIAAEKAGAVVPGATAIVGLGGEPESQGLLAEALGSAALLVTPADRDGVGELGLAGEHQRDNAAAAAVAARHLGYSEEAIAAGLRRARLAGRLEQMGDLILDGAHNADATAALARYLDELPPARTAAVVAVSSDKDLPALLGPLRDRFDLAVATRFQNDRALSIERLAPALEIIAPTVDTAPTVQAALEVAGSSADRVVLFGSLYAIAEAKNAATDAVRLSDPSPKTKPAT